MKGSEITKAHASRRGRRGWGWGRGQRHLRKECLFLKETLNLQTKIKDIKSFFN